MRRRFLPWKGRFDLGPTFNSLWAASTASNLGDGVLSLALPLLVVSQTSSPTAVAALTVAASVATLTLSLPAGVLLDSSDRLRLFRAANFVRLSIAAVLTLCVAISYTPLALIYLTAFTLQAGAVFTDGAAATLVPSTVGDQELPNANSRRYASELTANEFLGPPVAGILFASAHWAPFAWIASALLVAALALRQLRRRLPQDTQPQRQPATSTTFVARARASSTQAADGLRYLRGNRRVRALVGWAAMANLAGSITFALLVLYAVGPGQLGLSSSSFGLLMSALGIGGLVGAVTAQPMSRRVRPVLLLAWAAALMSLDSIALLLSTSLTIVLPSLVVASAGAGLFSVLAVSLLQSSTPDAMLGRKIAVYRLATGLSVPAGALIAAALVESTGSFKPAFAMAAAVFLISLGFSRPLSQRQHSPTT